MGEAAGSGGPCLSELLLILSLSFPNFSPPTVFSFLDVLSLFWISLPPGHTQVFISPSVDLWYVLSDFIKILKIWDKERENCTVVRGSLKARVWHKVEFSALEGFTRRFSQCEFSPCAVLTLTQSCPTLCNLRDCSPPGNSVHGISQARILEWVATSYSRGIFLTQGSNLCLYRVFLSLLLGCWSPARSLGPLLSRSPSGPVSLSRDPSSPSCLGQLLHSHRYSRLSRVSTMGLMYSLIY